MNPGVFIKEARMDANLSGARSRRGRWGAGALVALAITVPAAMAQRPEDRTVTRPDGTVVLPYVNERETRGSMGSSRERWSRDVDRDSLRSESRQSAAEQLEKRMRERQGAAQNPVRQVPPSERR
jgi:hypothetical protein